MDARSSGNVVEAACSRITQNRNVFTDPDQRLVQVMKICIVTESPPKKIDGGAVHSRLLSEWINKAGHEAIVDMRRPGVEYTSPHFSPGFRIQVHL